MLYKYENIWEIEVMLENDIACDREEIAEYMCGLDSMIYMTCGGK